LGFRDEFEDAIRKIIKQVRFDNDARIQVFEVTIRVLGGLLSGHMLATDPILGFKLDWYNGELLGLAKDLGDRLMPAFDTKYGLPFPRVFTI
jgi:mannosidase alpha-like ER degradation enhancer 1